MTTSSNPNRVYSAADLVNGSSSQLVVAKLQDLLINNSWLPPHHFYADVTSALRPSSSPVNGIALMEYVAYSMPLHVVDAWAFLERAFDAVKAGDSNSAIHMAYYAELRAAMSLLASEGVGVFWSRHVAIGPNHNTSDWVGKGTHNATWELLDAWADDSTRTSTLLDGIRVEQRSIAEWFNEAGITAQVSHVVARDWLKEWSLDISLFSGDHALRNHVSYRPSQILSAPAPPTNFVQEAVEPILRTWDSLEPATLIGGAAIDKELLNRALSYARDRDNLKPGDWDDFIDQSLPTAPESLKLSLKSPIGSSFPIMNWAQDSSSPPPAKSVIARATLLLRLANAVCAQRLEQAGVKKGDLRFWWDKFGQDCGFWPQGNAPQYFTHLWDPVNSSFSEVDSAIPSIATPFAMSEIQEIIGPQAPLTQQSRALFWLLNLD